MKKKKLYEAYHRNTSSQKRILDEGNFTYANIFNVLSKYSKPKKKVLDIGCGAGSLSFYMSGKGNKVLGIDVSKSAIEACRKTAKGLGLDADFKVMDFPLEYPRGKFDLVIFSEVIEHIGDDGKALDIIYKLLNKNGILFLTTPSSNAPLYKMGLLDGFEKRVGHVRRHTLDELLEKLKRHKFKIVTEHKKEGILRNILFTNDFFGMSLKIINRIPVLGKGFNSFDNLLVKVFGESQLIIIAEKA